MTIVTKLSGGLGNQLFQYAAGRQLAKQLQQPLAADLAWFNDTPSGSTPRQPLLSYFRIDLPFVDSRGNPSTLATPAKNLWQALTRPVRLHTDKTHFQYDTKTRNISRHNRLVYLDGYWQSYKYFDAIRGALLQELQPRAGLNIAYFDVARRIEETTSVMVHVRRGDYVHSSSASTVHGALPISYYERALSLMESRVADPTIFVFSDDIEWARANLASRWPTVYVNSAAHEAAVIDELMLMRLCKHQVIANSSLSWWGAWLNEHSGKTVVAPRAWLASRTLDLSDLIPSDWILIDVS